MPPKGVDKAKQAAKEKIAVDKTFGLKNKNKSKVVQKYIKSIHQNAQGAPKGGKEEAARKEKEQKANDVQKTALMNSLFNMGTDKKGRQFDPIAKKQAKQAEEEAVAAGKKLKEELRKEIIEGIANTIRLTNPKGIRMSELGGHQIILALKEKHAEHFKNLSLLLFIKANDKVFWVDDTESSNPTIRCQEDVDAEVAPDERPIEEIIEERRRALPPGGIPVTLVTFKAWKEKREAERLAKVEEGRKTDPKSGQKGLVGLSGRDLFTYDASLFVDDDDAVSAEEYEEREEVDDDDEEGDQKGDASESDDDEGDAGERSGDDEDCHDTVAIDESDAPAASSAQPSRSRGSDEPSNSKDNSGVPINANLFLEGEDLPDDLDLEDLDDDTEGK